ncbi:MAG: AAA family ATPase, partial [Christensenellales bacterium]
MKKISIDFDDKQSKQTLLYKTLKRNFGDEICSFEGFVDDKLIPVGECTVVTTNENGELETFIANFADAKMVGTCTLSEYDEEEEKYTPVVFFNFISENYGEIRFLDDSVYVGGLLYTYQHGKGKFTNADGSFNIGFYKQGEKHGLFLNYDKNSRLINKSVFVDGELVLTSTNDEEIVKALKKSDFENSTIVKQFSEVKEEEIVLSAEQIKKGLAKIEKNIIGQKEVIKKVNNHLLLSLLCERQENKPITSMVFTGPTGVGKTELAKQISQHIFNKKPFFVDFANFHDKFMLSSLIGSPAGYIGSDQEPDFLKYIRENQKTGGVLAFEEIDKAHEDCLNFFMRILDEGEVLDAHNRPYSVSNFIIVATTNFSANTTHKLGFSNNDDDVKEQLAKTETTGTKKEQLGRFGLVVEFDSFNKDEKRQLTIMALKRAVQRIKT